MATPGNNVASRVIEDASREFLARAARESRDLAILNESADALNREMEDVLAYQADVCFRGTIELPGIPDRNSARLNAAHGASPGSTLRRS